MKLELCTQEIEYLQGLFTDILESEKILSQYEIKRLQILLEKLSKLYICQ